MAVRGLPSSRLSGRSTRPGQADACPGLRSAAAACPHALARGDTPNLARILLDEPEIAIRPGRDASRPALGRRDAESSGEAAAGRDAPNGVHIEFREPEIAIRPGCDAVKPAVISGRTGRRQGELGDTASGGDAPDLVPKCFGKPEIAIRPGRDAGGEAILRLDVELGDAASGGDASDLANRFGEPEIAIRPGCDGVRPAATRGPTGRW